VDVPRENNTYGMAIVLDSVATWKAMSELLVRPLLLMEILVYMQ
jgi:hypothetical protein